MTLQRKKGIFSAHRGIYSSPKSNCLPCQNLEDSPFRQTFDQEAECMREESNHAKIDLEQVLIEGDKNRQTDQSLVTVTVLTDSMTVLPFHIPPTSPNWFKHHVNPLHLPGKGGPDLNMISMSHHNCFILTLYKHLIAHQDRHHCQADTASHGTPAWPTQAYSPSCCSFPLSILIA